MSNSAKSAEFQLLVEQLSDPRTRRPAAQKLVAARAVQPLVECLKSPVESVVWVAVKSLEELQAAEAVEPLVDLLERRVLVLDVCEALTRITGQDFGWDVERWRDWLRSSSGTVSEGLDVGECIRRAGEYLGVEPIGSGRSYQFKLSLPSGRKQKVAVYLGRQHARRGGGYVRMPHPATADEVVVIYSECGPAKPKHYETLLRKNLTIPAGAFAIRDIKGKPNLVMVDTMVAAAITPSALAKKIENIASLADSVEKSLTQEDKR